MSERTTRKERDIIENRARHGREEKYVMTDETSGNKGYLLSSIRGALLVADARHDRREKGLLSLERTYLKRSVIAAAVRFALKNYPAPSDDVFSLIHHRGAQ